MTTNRGAELVREIEQGVAAVYRDGAERIAADARAGAPVLRTESRFRVPGQLRDAISVVPPKISDGTVKAAVAIDESKGFYGRFQEEGFRAVGGRRQGSGQGRLVPGLHFMERAFDANRGAVGDRVVKVVQAAIDKANQ